MLASPESALSCPPLSLSRGRSLSHPSLFFPWELRLSALNQPLEDSVKPRGWPLTINLGPYVTRTRQKGVFREPREGRRGGEVCVGPAARGPPSLASVTCLHKGSSWRDSCLPWDGYLHSQLGEYHRGNISVLPGVWRPRPAEDGFRWGVVLFPPKKQERRPGEEGQEFTVSTALSS